MPIGPTPRPNQVARSALPDGGGGCPPLGSVQPWFACLCWFLQNQHNKLHPCCPPWRALRVCSSSKWEAHRVHLRKVRLLGGCSRLLDELVRRVVLLRESFAPCHWSTGRGGMSSIPNNPLAGVPVSRSQGIRSLAGPPVAPGLLAESKPRRVGELGPVLVVVVDDEILRLLERSTAL